MKISQRVANVAASGLFTIITLFLIWVPFLALYGFDLIQAVIQDGFCGPVGSGVNSLKGDFQAAFNAYVNARVKATPTRADEIRAYYAKLLASIDKLTASSIQHNSNFLTTEDSDANSTLKMHMWITLAAILISCMFGIWYIVTTYKLNWSTFLIRNFITLVVIMTVEVTIFGGIAMRYVPWNVNDILNSVLSEL